MIPALVMIYWMYGYWLEIVISDEVTWMIRTTVVKRWFVSRLTVVYTYLSYLF